MQKLIVVLLMLILFVVAPGIFVLGAVAIWSTWKAILFAFVVALVVGTAIAVYQRTAVQGPISTADKKLLKRAQRVADEANRRNRR